jgi:hypothetical protein
VVSGNITVFSAGSGAEYAVPWHEKRHGLFTYYLLKGLRGDADKNNNKILTVDELKNYINEMVPEQAGYLDAEQNPWFHINVPDQILVQYE